MSKSSDKLYMCAALTPVTITWIAGLESDTSQLCSFILERLTGVDIVVQTAFHSIHHNFNAFHTLHSFIAKLRCFNNLVCIREGLITLQEEVVDHRTNRT